MRFSATDAAFEGFRVVRREPLVLLTWTVLYLGVLVATVIGMAAVAPAQAELIRLSASMQGAPSQSLEELSPLLQAYGQVMSGMAWVFVLTIIVHVVLMTAITRAVLAPRRAEWFGYVRLGVDELRATVVTLVLVVLMTLIWFVVVVIASMIGALVGAAVGDAAFLVALGSIGFAIAFMIWLAIRWSLAVPITVAERKLAFFESFRITRGRFWPLLGMMILSVVMAVLVGLLSMLVTQPINLIARSDHSAEWTVQEAIQAFTNPWVVVSALLGAVFYVLFFGVIYAPLAAAYRELSGRGEAAED